jgi:hypothetical protein
MTKTTNISLMLTVAFGIAAANVPSAHAQSTLGGVKQQQSKIGGVAKPAPVLGGTTVHTASPLNPPKPAPVVGSVKPATPGVTPPATANTLGQAPHPTPPVTTTKKSGAVVTNNMKCANGACTSAVPKP